VSLINASVRVGLALGDSARLDEYGNYDVTIGE
jgi:hypothetical protein